MKYRLASKLFSLKAIKTVFEEPWKVLRVYFFGGKQVVHLKDMYGNSIPIEINRNNVNKVVFLARILFSILPIFGDYRIEQQQHSILIPITKNYFETLSLDIIKQDLEWDTLWNIHDWFYGLSLLRIFNYNIRSFDEKYVLLNNDYTFIVRKRVGDDLNFSLLIHEQYEYRRWFIPILFASEDDRIFVDVGAHIGGYSVRACKMNAKVIAIEPEEENFKLLKRNLKLNSCHSCITLKKAAGKEKAILPLYDAQSSGGYSLVNTSKTKRIKEYVEVEPLDDLVLPYIPYNSKIRLMKIDVEGAELEVLEGAPKTLKRTQYLMIEIWRKNLQRTTKLLRSQGFKPVDKGSVTKTISNMLFKNTAL